MIVYFKIFFLQNETLKSAGQKVISQAQYVANAAPLTTARRPQFGGILKIVPNGDLKR